MKGEKKPFDIFRLKGAKPKPIALVSINQKVNKAIAQIADSVEKNNGSLRHVTSPVYTRERCCRALHT